jgi:hypothetical protein
MVDLVYERVAHDEPRHLRGSSRLDLIYGLSGDVVRYDTAVSGVRGRKGVVAYPGVDKADTSSTVSAGWYVARC